MQFPQANMTLSSAYAEILVHSAWRCSNSTTPGPSQPFVGCHSSPDDADPTLTISYNCNRGLTSLCQVVVYNRDRPQNNMRAIGRIQYLQMDFYSANGCLDFTQPFNGSFTSFSFVPPPGACWRLLPAVAVVAATAFAATVDLRLPWKP
jgi:hypothetical protein